MSRVITSKKHQEIVELLQAQEFWSPNFTKISRRIGISVSTIYEWYKKLINKDMVACHIRIDVFNEPKIVKQQYDKWKKENAVKN